MKNFSINIAMLLIASFLSSCSSHYVSTNIDEENFSNYFSASKVTIYESEKTIPTRYKLIGSVEGQDCQIKAHHAEPDKVNARTQARQQALKISANAVVFSGCTTLNQTQLAQLSQSNDAQQCHAIVICYAKAYAIETKSTSND